MKPLPPGHGRYSCPELADGCHLAECSITKGRGGRLFISPFWMIQCGSLQVRAPTITVLLGIIIEMGSYYDGKSARSPGWLGSRNLN
jgi:hypothetical protein